jgi:hypothetical protein
MPSKEASSNGSSMVMVESTQVERSLCHRGRLRMAKAPLVQIRGPGSRGVLTHRKRPDAEPLSDPAVSQSSLPRDHRGAVGQN